MHFYGAVDHEARRLAVLEGYQVLDTECERDFDDLAAIAAEVCDTPIALIVFIDRSRQWFKARVGLEKHETPRAVAFCHYTIQGRSPFIVPDTLLDERFEHNPLVTSDPKMRFYAGVPLLTPESPQNESFALGTICVIDRVPRTLTQEQLDCLTALGRQVNSQLELRRRLRNEAALKNELENRVRERTQELAEALKEAQSASRMKSAFLANMSHEIRTPLSAIMGFADLLKDSGLPAEERNSYLEIVNRNGEHLQSVINDILDISKIEAGHLQTEHLRFSPRTVVYEVLQLLKMKADEKGLALNCQFDDKVPSSIVSDPIRLKQILMNIVGNAIKFTQVGEVNVSANVDDSDPRHPRVSLEVRDTGPGITHEQQGRLFKAFSQADESMTRKHGGTGLGLSLSKRLAELLGGDVTIKETKPNLGSTFKITIMDQSVETGVESLHLEAIEAAPLQLDALKTANILVVDDSSDNQELIGRILKKYGAQVETAFNGREGVAKALAGHHDLVLMDLQMPVLDGYSATARLRSCGFAKPIIALTAHALPDNRKRCTDLGCTDHLSKPIQTKELIRAIHRYLPSNKAPEQVGLV